MSWEFAVCLALAELGEVMLNSNSQRCYRGLLGNFLGFYSGILTFYFLTKWVPKVKLLLWEHLG